MRSAFPMINKSARLYVCSLFSLSLSLSKLIQLLKGIPFTEYLRISNFVLEPHLLKWCKEMKITKKEHIQLLILSL